MADSTVDVAGIKAAAAALIGDDGAINFLKHGKKELEDARLGSMSLSLFGLWAGAVDAHNAAVDAHIENLKGGIEKLEEVAGKLNLVANNWNKSDQPWVVKES
ncbi:hypothetical protein R8Z50_06725 [Longispora sp. K20-0274]|uniref:hypothetical protein n=1 Tax=Longispora sp. K20-0274 TaxID=3088255 RepID=UPI00399AACE9